MGQRRVTEDDRTEAKRLLLRALTTDVDFERLNWAAHDLHVQHNTFPGEEFMRLAADALEMAGVDRSNPIAYETLLTEHLPEIEFRGKEYRRIKYAVMASASLRGGLEPDLLDEVSYWIEVYWRYALYAAIALIRASAATTNRTVPGLVEQLAQRHQVDLSPGPAESGNDP